MPREGEQPRALGTAQIEQFIQDGFVRIDEAFPRQLADESRAILWRDLPCEADDPATWTRPVIRLGWYGDEPFRLAVNTPMLHAAFDQIVGGGRWRPRNGLSTFPVRFAHPDDPADAGWHVDVSFPGDDCDPNEKRDFFCLAREHHLAGTRALDAVPALRRRRERCADANPRGFASRHGKVPRAGR